MNQITKRILENTALCAVLALDSSHAVWNRRGARAGDPRPRPTPTTAPGRTPRAAGPFRTTSAELDVSELGALDETACLAAGWNWDPQNLTGSSCYYNRPECLARIFYGVPVTPGAPLIDVGPGTYDTSSRVHRRRPARVAWTSGACNDGESRNQSHLRKPGSLLVLPACRGIFTWDAELRLRRLGPASTPSAPSATTTGTIRRTSRARTTTAPSARSPRPTS